MKTFIITGASKGLGAAIAKRVLGSSDRCILISRTKDPEWEEVASQSGTKFTFLPMDLKETEKLSSLVRDMLMEVDAKSDIYFINNAGVIDPIKPIGNLGQESLETSMRVNFMAPAVLTDEFIKQTKDSDRKKVVVNISSGAAKILTMAGPPIAVRRQDSKCSQGWQVWNKVKHLSLRLSFLSLLV